ncbi:DEAD/DEAH box helicase [Nocardioides alcanivorans]|uniref:DEAD/DEAH box helicase n=1 Tax=Nocardioides alcanivorans TaxID=2897352 RepID=UPI001F38313F|nr:DEAD/DEAH box helicase [Nocardioides alcanivorans]
MAQRRQNRSGGGRKQRDNEGILPVLAKAVREVEHDVQRRQISTTTHTKFQVIALLARDERKRVKADTDLSEAQRDGQLKRLDGIATILAQTAASEPQFFHLLADEAEVSESAKRMMREMQIAGGMQPPPEKEPAPEDPEAVARHERQVTPPSVRAAQLAQPFRAPVYLTPVEMPQERRLIGWELIEPLLNSFEQAKPGARSSMELPEPLTTTTPSGRELMLHQAQVISSAAKGHRTFLLADEPGLGKTAQALLAAEAAGAYPLLCVVPNVVKTNWAREAKAWTPHRNVTVIHGDGESMDGFADIVVVNYEVLDRHVDWMGNHGFRGMVVDEAHFIKNRKSQRSRNVLDIADRLRRRSGNPLMMALTGTPLINDVDDFRAVWEFLGWIDQKVPTRPLMAALERTGLTPIDHAFYPAARSAVVDQGIVRRRKVDVASDIPARRVADLPVELEGALGRSIRDAERELATRLMQRYDAAIATRAAKAAKAGEEFDAGEIDLDLVRRVAGWEVNDANGASTGGNVFSMVREIGRAKVTMAADYAAQLAHSTGKVVFFAKHIDVMDTAQAYFEQRGIRYATVRGDQSSTTRQNQIDAFVNDPEVKVIVCSLTAAGVGLNLQVSSNVVLAELSWTNAEQTQAIDRVHRIGQTEPVTAWRLIAAQTIDARIAQLIDSKASLAARALDGSDEEIVDSADIQVEALVGLLEDALRERAALA